MLHRHFCTYFDHRYLPRGLALRDSLARFCPEFTLWVLALDAEVSSYLVQAAPENLRVVTLQELERRDPALLATRASRSQIEYYFTCSPCFPRLLLETNADIDAITYLDADLFFFSDPEPIFAELANESVGLTPHRFSASALRSHSRFGTYNVGWLTFRRDPDGMACLAWWREQCLAWCFDRVEGARYADQGYLDEFASRFEHVHAIAHPGANLAPWNIARHDVGLDGVQVTVDGRPLVFFHFQGLKEVRANVYDTNLGGYGARLDPVTRDHVFRPYLSSLTAWHARVAATSTPSSSTASARRSMRGLVGLKRWVGRQLATFNAAVHGNLIRI